MKKIEKEIIETVLKHSDELLNENWQSISEMLKEVPDGKINVGLTVALDWSEAKPRIKTVISYSRKWKDEREDELDDPNQPRLNLGGDTRVTVDFHAAEAEPSNATPSPSDLEPGPDTPTPPENNGGDNGEPKPKRSRKSKVS